VAASAPSKALLNTEASMAGVQIAKPANPDESVNSTVSDIALKASVRKALLMNAMAAQSLYNRFVLRTPGLRGDVIVGITVRPDGHIIDGSIASATSGSIALDQALIRLVLKWKLAPFADNRPRYVAVPFRFEPAGP
jgi:TonB family protein